MLDSVHRHNAPEQQVASLSVRLQPPGMMHWLAVQHVAESPLPQTGMLVGPVRPPTSGENNGSVGTIGQAAQKMWLAADAHRDPSPSTTRRLRLTNLCVLHLNQVR
jgi:hypothetical protein